MRRVKKTDFRIPAALIFVMAIVSVTVADVTLPASICDNMVLKQNTEIVIWGWANPDEKVSVKGEWSDTTVSTVAAKNGQWLVKINTPSKGGPYTIDIKGNNHIVLTNIFVDKAKAVFNQSNKKKTNVGQKTQEPEQKDKSNAANKTSDNTLAAGSTIVNNRTAGGSPFDDPAVIGEWKSVDFVREIGDFNPAKKSWQGDLYLKELVFFPNGKTFKPWWTWTKGQVYHSGSKTTARYEIKNIGGQTYMFFEWMSGDVVFRHQKPRYYVLKKS